jgi:ADP-ribose diphosphatase
MNKRNSTIVYRGMVVDLEQFDVEIGSKGWHRFQVVRHPGGVGVLPLHPDGTVSLIRQFRPAIAAAMLEIPAGRLDPAEEPADCGRRELLEETGLRAAQLLPLGLFHSSPGVFDERIHLYAATGLTQGAAQPEADEEIATIRLPLTDALQMARDGRITDGKTIAALFRACEVRP